MTPIKYFLGHSLFFRNIIIHIVGLMGLCYLWDPIWFLWSLLSAFFIVTFGFEIGPHRYFSHRSFKCTKRTELFLYFCMLLSGFHYPKDFAFMHRIHHKESDNEYDPHIASTNVWAIWFQFYNKPRERIYGRDIITDLDNDKLLNLFQKYSFMIYFIMVLFAAIISIKFTFYFFILGGIFAIHTGSSLIVLCHKPYGNGYRTFDNNDKSINNPWCWFMWGGQWHNNHHTMPWCYTTKVKWWEFDLCGWIIKHFLATEINDYNNDYKPKKVKLKE